ncbi:MAG: tRNA uracil 4-sulfurtransferase ThiI [Planctomycetota bacterium]
MALLSVHFHELALKGGNRPRFQRALRENLQRSLAPLGRCSVRSLGGRLLVESDAAADEAIDRAARVCGVAHVFRAQRLPRDLDTVGEAIVDDFEGRAIESFRITTRRVDKTFPLLSMQVDREVGARVQRGTGLKVQLKGADEDVHLTVFPSEILVGYGKRSGPGGLPVGTGGRVAVLMSGGIDSPVAAWQMINRGCRADLVHFHSYPLVDRTTQEKARDLAERLTEWQYQTRLHLVPLAQIQTEIRLKCPESLRVILYRRFMLRLAERIARRRRCGALVTGESLGQVASQTLANLATVDAVATLPVLRPLVGSDKQDIVRVAERLGTYAISVLPDQDCCRLFVPQHPATKSTPDEGADAERALEVDALVADSLARTETVDLA